MKHYVSNVTGIAAVEFALIAPILILLVVGMYDFCTYINTAMKLENTAVSAAQFVLQGGDPDDIEEEVIMQSTLNLTASNRDTVNVSSEYVCACHDGETVDCDGGLCTDSGDYVHRYFEVTTSMNFQTVISYPGMPASVPLYGFATLRIN